MGMVVKTNMMALNSNRALNTNNSTVAKNVEKLSTGMKINRAADDASGLAISEKMKAQIKALDTASANAEDGISLIQTAEGYMGEVHDMLNRIVELAEKSANGTYETVASGAGYEGFSTGGANQTATDRQALQEEVNNLCAEIDRIAETANFNNLKLMNGSLDADNATSKFAKVTQDWVSGTAGSMSSATVDVTGYALNLQIGETSGKFDKLSVNIKSFKTEQLFAGLAGKDCQVTTVSGVNSSLQNVLANNAVSGYGGVSQNVSGLTINISNQDVASLAAEKVRDVIDNVSAQRATLGAQQNRLEYTVNNLNTASENITSANSRIRDTDMAKEMMKYTQANVLTQAAQSMLAQANQAPQQILQLLQ